jgi:ATP synthase F1 complex assembly factor 1
MLQRQKNMANCLQPLSSILNLPLLHLTPHDADAISKIWTTFHTAHPTLASSYLSASLPASTYNSMVSLAQADPFFILPLPRNAASDESGAFKTDEYEMFYLQWLFHPTSTSSAPPSPDANPEPLPPLTSVIFTPLEEFKTAGEWASPHLVLTHYPDLAHTHNTVLMRGEISAASAGGPPGSLSNPGYLLSQQQAQLLALALQRFYCAGIVPLGESEQGRLDREKRAEALRGLREKPGEWDWRGLVDMAYGGIV